MKDSIFSKKSVLLGLFLMVMGMCFVSCSSDDDDDKVMSEIKYTWGVDGTDAADMSQVSLLSVFFMPALSNTYTFENVTVSTANSEMIGRGQDVEKALNAAISAGELKLSSSVTFYIDNTTTGKRVFAASFGPK